MMTLAARLEATPAAALREPTFADLSHIPGDDGPPLVGHTLRLLADPKGETERRAARYGLIIRGRSFGHRNVTLLGPDANEFVLFDRNRLFSSAAGWNPFLERLFPRGLMLLDFDEHRLHRKALAVAFKSEPLKAYFDGLNAGISAQMATWAKCPGETRIYTAMKALTLDLAASAFFGRDLGADREPLKRAFVDMVAAAVSVIRVALPGTALARGVKGRRFMIDFLTREIAARREGGGADLFSELCRASTDDGRLLSAPEIVDHMSFLMMAAHDTLTSSLTAFVWFLTANPDWAARLREEIAALDLPAGAPLPYERLDDLPLTEMAFKETLRLVPPVPSIPRRIVADTSFGGYKIPSGTRIAISTLHTHHMPDVWPDPARFDPLRFRDEAVRARHKFAYVPYGGGAHMCLGLHFAQMQAKCFAFHFLGAVQTRAAAGYQPDWIYWPIPKPRDGLRLEVRPT
jgi:cytochrome P450